MKDSYVFLAEGFEEVEALTVVDIMRRAGMPVRTVSITSSLQVKGAHGVTVTADVLFDSVLFADSEWLVLPGGLPGATNLREFAPLCGLLKQQAESAKGRIAAICASPAVVLGSLGLLKGEKATGYPGTESALECAEVVQAPVVVSGKFVLGAGPAAAMVWALAIVTQTLGEHVAQKLANDLLLYPRSEEEIDWYFG